jgi:hypothetical protein
MKHTIYLPKRIINLSAYNLPNAGPNCNITGMRNLYWGRNAFLARQGDYVYNISADRELLTRLWHYFED